MALTKTDIYAAFVELDLSTDAGPNTAQDALVTAKLAEAEAMTDRSLYPSTAQADLAVKYLTARLVALSPAGMNLKLAAKNGSTIYDGVWDLLKQAVSSGYRVP